MHTHGRPAGPDRAAPANRGDGPEAVLGRQRAELAAQAAALRADLDGIVAASAGSNADDEHDPEGATIAFERAQAAALLDRTLARAAALDRALARVAAGTYGTCAVCGRPIGAGRLEARPDAETCVRCAARS